MWSRFLPETAFLFLIRKLVCLKSPMATTCLNCGTAITDKFCPHCGQKSEVSRLTWHSLGEEIFHFFTHIEKGFFLTVSQLIIYPGRLMKNYLDGKRKEYHKPVGFLLIWITVFLLIYHFSLAATHYTSHTTRSLLTYDAATTEIMNKYRSLVEILILPFIALTGWLLIARKKLNYVEVLAASFYTISFLFILLSVQLTISLLFHLNFRTNTFDIITTSVYGGWALYAAVDFYKQYHIRHLVLKVLIALLLNIFIYFTLVRIIVRLLIWLNIA